MANKLDDEQFQRDTLLHVLRQTEADGVLVLLFKRGEDASVWCATIQDGRNTAAAVAILREVADEARELRDTIAQLADRISREHSGGAS